MEVEGVRLHYVRQGEGPPVLFLRCGRCSLGYFTQTPVYPPAVAEYNELLSEIG